MREHLVSYIRFVGFSGAALVIALFMKLSPSAEAGALPEPLQSEPPNAGQTTVSIASGSETFEILEAELKRIDAEIANLRKALEIMAPLPEHADVFIPKDPAREKSAVAQALDPATTVRMSELYAPAPVLTGAKSLFYEAELGSFRSRQAAEANWRRIAARGSRLSGMAPRYTAVGADTRLSAGPLTSPAAVDALCVELSALNGPCRPLPALRAY